MRRVFITGANRGIGLEFARQCLQRGDQVFASCRRPGQAIDLHQLNSAYPDTLTILPLDVADPAQIESAAQLVSSHISGLDILINNAALHSRGDTLEALEAEQMLELLQVNAVAPVMVVQRFSDLLSAGDQPKVLNISSRLGSITRKKDASKYDYSASKAALNMYTRILAHELKEKGIIVIALSPGHVNTRPRPLNAPLSPEESIKGMLTVIDALTLEKSAAFIHMDGTEVPW